MGTYCNAKNGITRENRGDYEENQSKFGGNFGLGLGPWALGFGL
jgi:hypothetical protein